MPTGNPIYKDPRWKTLRKQVLAEEPTCHWCHRAPSTQADHVIELDRGGDPFDRLNIVGSCAPCNSARGARYVNRKTAQRIQTRREATKPFLFADNKHPDAPSSFSLNETEPAGTGLDRAGSDTLLGGSAPRLVTPVEAAGTYGPEVGSFAEAIYGITLMPWQQKVIDDQLSFGEDGRLLFSSALTSTARQQGKSVALKVLASWWAVGMATHRGTPQSVVLVANEYERVSVMFREMEPVLTEKFGAKSYKSFGRESLTFPDGSTIRLAAATDGKHGYSIDYLLLDEIWQIKPSVVYQAFRPAMIARRDSQMSCWSTAGDAGSTVLQQMRAQGIQAIDSGQTGRAYFCEFSPPAGVDPSDRRWWPMANPALGITVDLEALEDAWQSVPRAEFVRAHLNLWQGANDSWLPPDVWDGLAVNIDAPTGGFLAVDSSLDENRIVGVRATRIGIEILITVAFVVDRQQAMWTEIAKVLDDTDCQLLIPKGWEPLVPPDYRRRTEYFGYQELKTMTPIVRRAILDGQIRHTGEVALAEHINQAVMVKTNDGAPLSSQKSPGPIELARCAVFAAGRALAPVVRKKAAFASG